VKTCANRATRSRCAPSPPPRWPAIASAADERTALLVRTAASTGLRFGKIAGLEWKQIDLEKGIIAVARQFTHGAWSELKTANSRRRIPVARELLHQLKVHRLRTQGELVFPGGEGKPIDYHNWRARAWAPLLKLAGVSGTFHMLRHFFVTALIQSGVNAKVARTLAGHHSASFTLDQYADAVQLAAGTARRRPGPQRIVAAVLHQKRRSEQLARLRSEIQKGLDSAPAGKLDINLVIRRGRRRLAARARARS